MYSSPASSMPMTRNSSNNFFGFSDSMVKPAFLVVVVVVFGFFVIVFELVLVLM